MKWSGLIRKLLAGILVIEIMMLSILVYNSVRLLNTTHAELFERTVNEEVTLLSSLLVGGLSVRDLALIHENLQLFSKQANVKYAVVYDRHDRVVGKVGNVPDNFVLDQSFHQTETDNVYDTEQKILFEGALFGTLRAGFSVEEILLLSETAKLQNTTIASIEIVLTILATIFVGIYLIKRITTLQTGARALQEGDYSYQIPVTDKDELGELADAFNKLGTSLDKSSKEILEKQDEIEKRAARFSDLLNSVNAVIFEATIDPFTVIFVNKEAESLLGYPPDDWQSMGFLERITHEKDTKRVKQFVENPENEEFHSFEYRVKKHNGELIWLRQITNIEKVDTHKTIRGILIDVTKEKRNADVERARDIALAENRAKSQFLASMSHELRTPLNAIIGYAELLAEVNLNDKVLDRDFVADDVEKITRSSKHLLTLINEILDLSKISAGKFVIKVRQFDLTELLNDVIDVTRPLAEKNNNLLNITLKNNLVVEADRQRLYQVVVNLCANACKFTENGRIDVTVDYEPGASEYMIHVIDTGIGIKPEDLGKVFDEFERTRDVDEKEGTGLGLSLSQKLCKIMGGHITVVSSYGSGSTFTVSMPLQVKPQSQEPVDSQPRIVPNKLASGHR